MRYTETKLDKIVRIGMSRIDQVFDKCCDDLEALRPKPMVDLPWLFESDEDRSYERLTRQVLASQAEAARRNAEYDIAYGFANALNNSALMGSMGNGSSPLGSLLRDANSGRQGF